jgi:hypothetical protein
LSEMVIDVQNLLQILELPDRDSVQRAERSWPGPSGGPGGRKLRRGPRVLAEGQCYKFLPKKLAISTHDICMSVLCNAQKFAEMWAKLPQMVVINFDF